MRLTILTRLIQRTTGVSEDRIEYEYEYEYEYRDAEYEYDIGGTLSLIAKLLHIFRLVRPIDSKQIHKTPVDSFIFCRIAIVFVPYSRHRCN